jgi:microcystin-dependent protein
MIDPYVGEIMGFAGTFVPVDFLPCDGRLLSINDHQTLFSLLGTSYGGDGVTTFALPDLSNRAPVHVTDSLGETRDAASPPDGAGATLPGSIAMNWCICVDGTYPRRIGVPTGSYLETGTTTSERTVAAGADAAVPGTLRMDWFICTGGLYPERP